MSCLPKAIVLPVPGNGPVRIVTHGKYSPGNVDGQAADAHQYNSLANCCINDDIVAAQQIMLHRNQ
jgi:hypothetical protein